MKRLLTNRALRPAGLVIALALVSAQGCGTGAYDELVNQRLGGLKQGEPFAVLFAPTDLPQVPVKIRVPQKFKNPPFTPGSQDLKGQAVSAERMQPPFVPLPGFKYCYEVQQPNKEGKQVPYYCYLAVVPVKTQSAAALEQDLMTKTKAALPDAKSWEAVSVKTPQGGEIAWKKLSASGPQPFSVENGAERENATLPGSFELWVHEGKDYTVIVGWRAPAEFEAELGLAQLAPATAGTLEVGA